MRWILIIIIYLLIGIKSSYSQLNVELIHQLVAESKSENERQNEAFSRQTVTTANEEVNRGKTATFKQKYRRLQQRFHTLGLVIDAAQIGMQTWPIIADIQNQQARIFTLAKDDPILIAMAYQVELDLLGKATQLSSYLYALLISIGDVNQMKASDRKMLFGHVLTELRLIAGSSRGLANSMYQQQLRHASSVNNPFSAFVNRDRQLVDNILSKIDQLK
ncbi:hypothetical protein [Sphingobacterium deserti]|uniref:Plasmid transfer protein n=1 Tax=Sphingobacterium deserti TaxID=1229276 RepID=A0A0B8T6B2_9SPHI|nr:hypothetical protein [Sphingobacterium deserti]KGE12640.1 hypothetical protein DI53_3680 [Sphingobacterium deserti]